MKEENEKNKALIETMSLERETLHNQLTKLAKLQKQGISLSKWSFSLNLLYCLRFI
jgi:hypothetical protein